MRRVLVPLDGSRLATKILPDAQRLAGSAGEIVLMHDVNHQTYEFATRAYGTQKLADVAQAYLDAQAADLREHGANVQVQTVMLNDVSLSIDEAARVFYADLIACATHGRGPVGRLVHGGVVWRTLAHSAVPVMLRHFEDDAPTDAGVLLGQRRVLVPLDRSPLAETAIPLATELAREWHAPIFLIYVVPEVRASGNPYGSMYITPSSYEADKQEALLYLDRISGQQPVEVHTRVIVGGVINSLVEAAEHLSITDIVMASHGRTGLPRMVLGSVADALVHRLTCPITIIPALAARHIESTTWLEKEDAIATR
jgi:nucleotide-binding universal stress UspA family protein